jgi:hypothetical protein
LRLGFLKATPRPRTLRASDVFAGFFCLYLASAGRSVPFEDAIPMWQAAENLVRHGNFAIDVRWPLNAPTGIGGRYYPVAPLLAILIHVPGALLQMLLARLSPDGAAAFAGVTAALGPLLAGAAVPALFFRILRQLDYQVRQAAWAALLLGAGTSVWVYARYPYSEAVQMLCFVIFFGALLRAAAAPARGTAARLGLAAALLINTKTIYVLCLPGALAYVAWRLRAGAIDRRQQLRLFGWVAVGLAPGFIALGWYNAIRWGSPLTSGYEAVTKGFWRENVLVGLWGLLLSPGKSVLLFSPVLLLAIAGARRLITHRRHVAIAIALVVAPIVLVYARYTFWSGDWAWGPRYLVFALPALMVPCAELFGDDRPRRWAARAAVTALLVAGIAVQGLGSAIRWDHYIQISRQAQHAWLGVPNRGGTVLAPDPCLSCFEEVYPVQWLPPMQPIAGHWWLLRHKLADHDWRQAEAGAPWKRYTSLTLDIEESYKEAGIDWWPTAAGAGRTALPVLVMLLLLVAIPIRPWLGALRPRSDQPPGTVR